VFKGTKRDAMLSKKMTRKARRDAKTAKDGESVLKRFVGSRSL